MVAFGRDAQAQAGPVTHMSSTEDSRTAYRRLEHDEKATGVSTILSSWSCKSQKLEARANPTDARSGAGALLSQEVRAERGGAGRRQREPAESCRRAPCTRPERLAGLFRANWCNSLAVFPHLG